MSQHTGDICDVCCYPAVVNYFKTLQVIRVHCLSGLDMRKKAILPPLLEGREVEGIPRLINSSSPISAHHALTPFHILDLDEVSKSNGARFVLCEFCGGASVSRTCGYLISILVVPQLNWRPKVSQCILLHTQWRKRQSVCFSSPLMPITPNSPEGGFP